MTHAGITLRTAILMIVLGASAAVGAQGKPKPKAPPPLEADVYLTPTCGCCGNWVQHLEAAKFTVKRTVTPELDGVPARRRVPENLRSCHTAVVGKYLVEGHVPVDLVERLLKERPDIAGIAVPGMPIGSPGMEGPNARPYSIVAFKADGTTYEFARR